MQLLHKYPQEVIDALKTSDRKAELGALAVSTVRIDIATAAAHFLTSNMAEEQWDALSVELNKSLPSKVKFAGGGGFIPRVRRIKKWCALCNMHANW